MSSTVHQVVGLGLAELVKICTSNSGGDSSSKSCPTNWWVGPGVVTAAAAVKPAVTKLSPCLSVTLWDKLEIQGDCSTTLQGFLDMMQQKYQLEVISYMIKTAKYLQSPAGDHGGAGLPHGVRALHARPQGQVTQADVQLGEETGQTGSCYFVSDCSSSRGGRGFMEGEGF